MLNQPGTITVFCGPMRSRKSQKLIEAIEDHERARLKILAVKPPNDSRDGSNIISKVIRKKGCRPIVLKSFRAHLVGSRKELMALIKKTHCDVLAADEVQFFGPWFLNALEEIAYERKLIVLLAGLDLDAWRKPFPAMPRMLAMATYTLKVQASCFVCGGLAQFTQKLKGSPNKKVEPGDHYEARCFRCHIMPEDLNL